jgi:putative DNA methylase
MPPSTTHPIIAPKKLIEVALPLDDINKASAREKSIRHGHPSTLHLWWARRPLAAARAVLFAQLVNDPSWKYTEAELKKPQVKSAVTRKRNELFRLISALVLWENTRNEELLDRAQAAIRESWRDTCEANKDHPDPQIRNLFDPERLPPFHDPFAGGGAIPLEAQRLGLDAHASDLNPVAVLINKAMIELPPKFADRLPVGPVPHGEKQTRAKATEQWSGARGLAEDVRRYGAWVHQEAFNRIGHLYPQVIVSKELAKARPDLKKFEGQKLNIIAWLWSRTVASPNPAARGHETPLIASFVLSNKDREWWWVEPVVDGEDWQFILRNGVPTAKQQERLQLGTRAGKAQDFECIITRTVVSREYIREQGQVGKLGRRLMAIVIDIGRGRTFIESSWATPPSLSAEENRAVDNARKTFLASATPSRAVLTGGICSAYGLSTWGSLYTDRQVLLLLTYCDIIRAAYAKCSEDAVRQGVSKADSEQYANAVVTYLGLAISKLSDAQSSLCRWKPSMEQVIASFGRQNLPMVWDHAESNGFAGMAGDFTVTIGNMARAIESLGKWSPGAAWQANAMESSAMPPQSIHSTDPPYYDNISYAEISDYFYCWIRRAVGQYYPEFMATLLVPKGEELVAIPIRHGGKREAEEFFLSGMTTALMNLANASHVAFPVSVYYAFKQSETDEHDGTSSTGWETFLEACLRSGFAVTATWPMRTELGNRLVSVGVNALASSIILAFRRRSTSAQSVSRKELLRELDRALPLALAQMTEDPLASIAPVDLAQAAIGPGMAIFSRYKSVLEADGTPMSVHSALIHINKAVDDYFAHAEGDMDADTRFCIGWFQQYGFETGPFGEADVLARAKGTSVDGVRDAGVLSSAKGKVRLLKVKEYAKDWDPTTDDRKPVWEACHQMSRALGQSESDAGALLARMPDKQDAIRQLAYRLYTLCERKGWADEARAYNELVTSWPAIVEESQKTGHRGTQLELL